MRATNRSYKKKKSSKITTKTHRKNKTHSKDEWQKVFRERFFV